MLLGLSCMQSLSAQFTDVSKWYHQDICATIPSMTDITKHQEIAAVNSSSPQLVTSFEFGQFGGHGGTQITVVDDLDGVMYQQPSSTNFTYSPDFNNLTKFTVKPLNLQYATPPCATYNYTGTVNVTKPGYQTFQFTVPSIVNSIINTYCMENNANPKPLLDMTITSPLIKVGTVIALRRTK